VLIASARPATEADLPDLGVLYEELETEMVALKPVWRLTDGLPEPIFEALAASIDDQDSGVLVGQIDDTTVGFLAWRHRALLPQATGAMAGVVELIFTTPEAREIGVGEAMISSFIDIASGRGIRLLDAIVPPGHRAAKNFFESNGFKARQIVMHREIR